MSYAIIRNEKLTRAKSIGAYTHNERKTKNHSNKNIDSSKTELNYYIKQNELSYIKEFDRIKEEHNIQGQIRSNSIIMCEMIITSDQAFFDKIGAEETKRYFEESYKFICNYKNLGEQNIISAVVHLDEDSPHLHLLYAPVIKTTDKQGNLINKLSCRDFWKGRDSYRDLQDKFHAHITSRGFDLERGKSVEETNRKHYKIQDYKEITNYDNTKKLMESIKLDLPDVPDIKDFKKTIINKYEKIEEQIIKPKDELIKSLYKDNVSLHKELSKQTKLIDKAKKYENEKHSILAENKELSSKCNVLEKDLKYETYRLENKYNSKINKLEKENKFLKKTIDKLKFAVGHFIVWICDKFSVSSEEQLMRDFYKETNISINPNNRQYDTEKSHPKEDEYDLER